MDILDVLQRTIAKLDGLQIPYMIRVQANSLDLDYLKQWACDLHVDDLLKKALDEASR